MRDGELLRRVGLSSLRMESVREIQEQMVEGRDYLGHWLGGFMVKLRCYTSVGN